MVDLTIDTSDIPPNLSTTQPLFREHLVDVFQQLLDHINNLANGIQHFDGVLVGTGSLDASAIFQINSTTKTFVPPRMTTTERDAIVSPLTGAWIYNTTLGCPQSYDGAAWVTYVPVSVDEASCRIRPSVSQSINSASNTVVNFGAEDYDTDNMHDLSVNNSRITFNTAGKYSIAACINFATSVANAVKLEIVLNGTTIIAGQTQSPPSAGASVNLSAATTYNFVSGDYIQIKAEHTSGSARSLDTTTTHLAVSRQLD